MMDLSINMSENRFIIVLCTCPDNAIAKGLAQDLVESRFAACINIIPNIQSVYRWDNKVTSSDEFLLVIKSTLAQYKQIEDLIFKKHPYDCPEVIACEISHGASNYLNWLQTETLII